MKRSLVKMECSSEHEILQKLVNKIIKQLEGDWPNTMEIVSVNISTCVDVDLIYYTAVIHCYYDREKEDEIFDRQKKELESTE